MGHHLLGNGVDKYLVDIYLYDMPPRESKSRYAVLGALSIEPMSGYQVKEMIDRTLGHFWTEGYGQIYPTLKHLAATGLATSRVKQTAGKPDRHVYSLTDAGLEELRRWLAQPVEAQRPGRNELLLKLFFGRHAPTGTNLEQLRRHRQLMVAQIVQFEAIEVELEADDSPDQPYWLITLRHGLHVSRASLAWCDDTIKFLSELNGQPL